LKIFVCEFITGGGLYREPLPASLAREGVLMRDALLRDLRELQDVEVTITYDNRLPAPTYASQAIPVSIHDDVWQIWSQCIAEADAVWPIAPETNGVLLRLTELVNSHHKTLLGCGTEGVRLASSKLATHLALQAAGVSAVPTYKLETWPKNQATHWVAKPDDGVGCEDSAYFATSQALANWIAQGREASHIIQPFQAGIPASISMLCKQGQAWLLSCNQQKITLDSSTFTYHGSVLNGMAEHWPAFETVAQQVAHAIPSLSGYVGIDILVDESRIYVLEVNPRLTTSYVGLHEAIGCNPARLVLDLLYNHGFQPSDFKMPEEISRNVIEVTLAVTLND
jgi:predicted ATP-grasp superfamily ATP-dependent carboligase